MSEQQKYENLCRDKRIIDFVSKNHLDQLSQRFTIDDKVIQLIYGELNKHVEYMKPLEKNNPFSFLLLKCIDYLLLFLESNTPENRDNLLTTFLIYTSDFNNALLEKNNDLINHITRKKANDYKQLQKKRIENDLIIRMIAKVLTDNEEFYNNQFCGHLFSEYMEYMKVSVVDFAETIKWYLKMNPQMVIKKSNNDNVLTKEVLGEFYKFCKGEIEFTAFISETKFDLSEYMKKNSLVTNSKNVREYLNKIDNDNTLFKLVRKLINKIYQTNTA